MLLLSGCPSCNNNSYEPLGDTVIHAGTDDMVKYDVNPSKNENGEMVFQASADDFIESFNTIYAVRNSGTYLTALDSWMQSGEKSPFYGHDALHYLFSADDTRWSMPTLSIFIPEDGQGIYELMLSYGNIGLYGYFGEGRANICIVPLADNAGEQLNLRSAESLSTQPQDIMTISLDDKRAFMKECKALGLLYKDIYSQAEKISSTLKSADAEISQQWRDKIEDVLIKVGYPLVNSSSDYPEYLENPEGIYAFWDSSYDKLCFNDLLAGMYLSDRGDYFYLQYLPSSMTPFFHYLIPAELFEQTILPHFDISLELFRELTLYDSESNTYPWQNTLAASGYYYPTVIPEVTDYVALTPDSFKLTVRVMCPDYHSDGVLTHEVTIRELPDGTWQYLSNQVTDRDDTEQPYPRSWVEAQRSGN